MHTLTLECPHTVCNTKLNIQFQASNPIRNFPNVTDRLDKHIINKAAENTVSSNRNFHLLPQCCPPSGSALSLHSMCHHHPLTASSAGERLIPCSCLCLLFLVCVCVCVCVCVYVHIYLQFQFSSSIVQQNCGYAVNTNKAATTGTRQANTVSVQLCIYVRVHVNISICTCTLYILVYTVYY